MLCCLLLASLSPAPVFALAAPPSLEAWRQSPQLTVRDAPPCRYGQTQRVADIQMKDIPEASALVASLQWPGVYWTVNDAHNEARLNAFDQEGRPRGSFPVDGATNVDWEALQLGPAPTGGWALYVGDVGDNDGKRPETTIYRLSEPQPLSPETADGSAPRVSAEAFRLSFPDGPHNAEAMLVHPQTGEVVLITKERGGVAGVYRVPVALGSQQQVALERVGGVDVRAGSAEKDVVTDASISPGADRVTIRTYTRALEYAVPDGASLASIWDQAPRVAPLNDGPKGEGITYRADGMALMSIGESSHPSIFQTPLEC